MNIVMKFLKRKFPLVNWEFILSYFKELTIEFFIEVLIWTISIVPIGVMYFCNYVNIIVYGLVYIAGVVTLYSILEEYKYQCKKEFMKQKFDGYNF